jgi:hypothetical protein
MRLSKSDIIAGSMGALALALLAYLLYAAMGYRSGPGNAELIGLVKSKRNITERKFSSRVVWDEVEKNTSVYNFDTIRTADRSEAVIRLKDGTEITLNENSMVLLSVSPKKFDIKFIQGAIKTRQSAAQGEAAARTVNIVSGGSTITLNNGDVSLSRDRDNGLNLTVNRGAAAFVSEKGKEIINKDQLIQYRKDGVRLYDLGIRLVSPENDAYVPAEEDTTTVRFAWELPGAGYASFLEIARNPSLVDPIMKKRAAGNGAPARLRDGIYYWRVSAIDRATKKIEASEVRRLTVANVRPARLITPADGSVIKYRDENPMINFAWTMNESVSRYNLLVSGKKDMSAPIVNTYVDGTRIAINSLGKGIYYWKIVNMPEAPPAGKNPESEVCSFTVAVTDKLPPPVPVYPPDNKTIHPLAIENKGLNFTWTKDPSIPETRITIAGDRELKSTVMTTTSGDNSVRIEKGLKEGVYYWSLSGLMSDGSTTGASRAFRFKVAREEAIRLVEPGNGTVLVDDKGDGIPVTFSWIKPDLEGGYQLRISRHRDFTPPVKEIQASDVSVKVPRLSDGSYYWSVRLADEKGAVVLASPVYLLKVLGRLGRPIAVEPKPGGTVNMLTKDALELRWAAVKGANLYRVGLFNVKDGIQHSVATAETAKNSYRFTDLNKLDVGRFILSLQAIDADPASGRAVRTSDETRMVFDISLGVEKKIRIKSPRILYLE